MDRKLLIRGINLLKAWEDLTPTHLHRWIDQFYPVAFTENKNGEFGAYPIGIYCKGSIIQSELKQTSQVLDRDSRYTLGWNASIDHNDNAYPLIKDLYFSVIHIDIYLKEEGFRLNDHEERSWEIRVKQAKQAALSLDDEYCISEKHTIDSKVFQIWLDYVNSITLRPTIHLSLVIFLKSLGGMSNAELKAEFARASISRYKATAKKFIAQNASLFNQLPKLPL